MPTRARHTSKFFKSQDQNTENQTLNNTRQSLAFSVWNRWYQLPLAAKFLFGMLPLAVITSVFYYDKYSSSSKDMIVNQDNIFPNLLDNIDYYSEQQLLDILSLSEYVSYGAKQWDKPNNQASIMKKIKIVVDPKHSNSHELRIKNTQNSFKIANAILQTQAKFPEAHYIDLVLNHPDFFISLTDINFSQSGVYHPDTHSLSIDLTLTEGELEKTILHEFWHAYKTLIHTHYLTPPKKYADKNIGPFLAYDINAHDKEARKRMLQSAIDKGDNRILNRLPELMKKQRVSPNSLTQQERKQLIAVERYIPRRHQGFLNPGNFNAHKQNLIQAINGHKTYKYSYTKNKQTFILYVDSYQQLADGGAMLEGYTSSDPNKYKAAALIGDTKELKYNLAARYRKYATDKTSFDEITERDAFITENGDEVNEVFYLERELFHLGEHKEFEEKMEKQQNKEVSDSYSSYMLK